MKIKYREVSEDKRQVLIKELQNQYAASKSDKDIIIIVHNQYDLVKACLDSVTLHTKNYRLFIWDNASNKQTSDLLLNYNPSVLVKHNENTGFIMPNNYLASLTTSPYIILLNSDTIVSPGWDDALIGTLESDDKLGVVGYQGRMLDNQGMGTTIAFGSNVDYVEGWCMCLPRAIYAKLGLFDPQLEFAYCEDSDLCLKIKANDYKLYTLQLQYVKHIGCATSKTLQEKVNYHLMKNQNYLKEKWKL